MKVQEIRNLNDKDLEKRLDDLKEEFLQPALSDDYRSA